MTLNELAISERLIGMLLAEARIGALSAVCGLRIDLPRALETLELGVLLVESVTIVRASSSSSSSRASFSPSLPDQVLKRLLAVEGRREETTDEGFVYVDPDW